MPVKHPGMPRTEAQYNLIIKLARELHGDAADAYLAGALPQATMRGEASELIDGLIAASKARRADQARKGGAAELPAEGYYAANYQGVLRFYKVVAGTGRWEGRTFLNRFRSDELGRVGRAEQSAFADAMAREGAAEAARLLFATELVRCFTCGRMLTDKISRECGQGPDCRARG